MKTNGTAQETTEISVDTLVSLARTIVEPELSQLPYVTEPKAGDVVGIYSRGAWRVAVVEKVGRKNVTAIYTTAGAITEAQKATRTPEALRAEADRYDGEGNWSDYAKRLRELADRVERDGWKGFITTTRKSTPITETLSLKNALETLKVESEARVASWTPEEIETLKQATGYDEPAAEPESETPYTDALLERLDADEARLEALKAPQYERPEWELLDEIQTVRCGKPGIRRAEDTRHASWIRRDAKRRGLKATVTLGDGVCHVRLMHDENSTPGLFVYAHSQYLAEIGDYRLVDAKNEQDVRKQVRGNARSTRGAFIAKAETFAANLERLVKLNEAGRGDARKLDQRRETLAYLREQLAARFIQANLEAAATNDEPEDDEELLEQAYGDGTTDRYPCKYGHYDCAAFEGGPCANETYARLLAAKRVEVK